MSRQTNRLINVTQIKCMPTHLHILLNYFRTLCPSSHHPINPIFLHTSSLFLTSHQSSYPSTLLNPSHITFSHLSVHHTTFSHDITSSVQHTPQDGHGCSECAAATQRPPTVAGDRCVLREGKLKLWRKEKERIK